MKKLKKLLSMVMAVIMIVTINLCCIPDISATEYNGYIYEENNGEITITGYNGTDTNLTIPQEIEGKPVAKLDSLCFSNHLTLESLEIPSSVKEIGSSIVYGIENTTFKKLILNEGLVSVGIGAFYGCENLTEVTIPKSVTDIGNSAFGVIDSLDNFDLIANGFILNCYKDTAGEKYARKMDMNYRLVDETPEVIHQSMAYALVYDKDQKMITHTTSLNWKYYTGKEVRPLSYVKYMSAIHGKMIKLDKAKYQVTYKNNKNIGTAKIILEGKGEYYGKNVVTFTIRPPKSKVKSLTNLGKGKIKVKWSKSAKATGYKIKYSANKGKTYKTAVTIRSGKTTSKVIKLKKNKTYYVQVVPFAKKDGKTIFSKPMNKKAIKL